MGGKRDEPAINANIFAAVTNRTRKTNKDKLAGPLSSLLDVYATSQQYMPVFLSCISIGEV
jgi:hypothetical protein